MSGQRQGARRRAADKRTALRSLPILADIDDEHLAQLSRMVEHHRVPANEWLFHAGDPSDAIYIVDSGRFVAINAAGHVVGEMASGESMGELGVIAGATRAAGVQALRDSAVWKIAADTFTDVLATTPRLQSVMLRAMATMLRESRSADISRRPRVIGVLSTGDVSAAPTVDAIATHLGCHGQTGVVAPSVDTTAEVDHYGELVEAFSATLDRAERINDWVLLVADRGSGELWRRYVVAQCDRLVVLVDQPRPPRAVDPLVTQRPIHLITRIAAPDPSWWDLLQPISHHPADDDGIAAFARRIAGRSLGLVMAGGGVRGLAHFGVYEELTRAGVVIDRFGGTSTGALVAGAIALGMDARKGIAAVREFVAQGYPFGDYAIPVVALTRGGRWDRLIEKFAAGSLIEHLSREFFCVSADIISGEQIVHRRGRLSVAVRASISIPGLLPPVADGERVLVDGGLVNNLPADVMCADPDGQVICVDLRRKYAPSKGFGLLPPVLQPPAFVRRFLTGTDVALPSLQETLLRIVDLTSASKNLRELPRIAAIIEPNVSGVGLLNFKQVDAAVEAGRMAARAAVEANPQLVRAASAHQVGVA